MRWSELLQDGRILFAVSGLCVAGLWLPASKPRDLVPAESTQVSLYPAQRGCVTTSMDAGEVDELRRSVVAELRKNGAEHASIGQLRRTLTELYGERVTEAAIPMFYGFVWDPIYGWVRVCISESSFEVDFGALGAMVVHARDTQYVDGHPE